MTTLSDDDWRAIKALKFDFSDETRLEIDQWLDLEVCLLRLFLSRQRPAAARGKLARLHAMASKLSRELAEINGHALLALILVDSDLSAPPAADDIGQLISSEKLLAERKAQISNISHWLKAAAERIGAGKRGPDGECNERLAGKCAEFLERHKAGRLSRSYKATAEAEFTKIVLRAAAKAAGSKELKSGTGAIRRAVKGAWQN
jgi:hypothetical protein